MNWVRALLLTGSLGVCLLGGAETGQAETIRYSQLVDGGLVRLRAITDRPTCPPALVDGHPVDLTLRAPPDATFPARICESVPLTRPDHAQIDGQPVPVPPANPQRIVIIGDTGCRTNGRVNQDCRDPRAWPFPTLARRAAAEHPDLVIHVGDYLYREARCAAGHPGCAGSPFGDRWLAWKADLFTPAAPLFAAATWITFRGNHEECRRGGTGWFRLLEPNLPAATCQDGTPPYRVVAGKLTLAVFDSATAPDDIASPANAETLAAQAHQAVAMAGPDGWIGTHRPIWGVIRGDAGSATVINRALQTAFHELWDGGVTTILSGHIHTVELLDAGPTRPIQLILGNSGDDLDEDAAGPLQSGMRVDGLVIARAISRPGFGYAVLTPSESGWLLTLHNAEGRVTGQVGLAGRHLT